jgi:hypothetical protein
MSYDIVCRKCDYDLEQWNCGQYLRMTYCPHCGKRLLKRQSDELYRRTTSEEVSDIIREHLLAVLADSAIVGQAQGDLPRRAWESESCDGVVFYANYLADLFVVRHLDWVYAALDYMAREWGQSAFSINVGAACNDRLLVDVFFLATERYVFGQLGVAAGREPLTRRSVRELRRLIQATPYNGEF